ncbi:multidrug ABC transporter ATP-binding protein [Alkalihalobacillus alcalophilus ATCC 27647 = CGMCC 1.3604]|nr:ABC-F family ATP-binding cassette domain-containing protein [Alkalihalobacillus alcalophilus]KGA97477.1 multidrug ABC transporter ATP-binding protein [Alkalihalobacillus alcalophilus ATCC 27647 = CGMCC 1.3604]MED1563280.1 ABC-F family ATP-binding cassette domain-containing protein [Alkalihalobacillus alcalophilus]THG92237.1 multidrug ABC transporter ATP-binding protein [Alkalihalobacillus alcalophilus ATCC 27647 = CGMCC 1.3604]
MSLLQIEHLTKTFGEKVLFQDLNFSINEKERIGLIGVNGTGKSSLLKAIARIEEADKGEFIHANDFQVEYLAQQPELDLELTVLEQIYYGETPMMVTMRRYEQALFELELSNDEKKLQTLMKLQQDMDRLEAWEANTVAKTILTKLGIKEFGKKVSELSGGQKKRVAIAKALINPVDLLLLDEPTNHLDNETIEWLEGFLGQYKGSFIVITHDRYFLNRVTNQIFELDRGRLFRYQGNYEVFLEKKAEREAIETQQESKRQNLLRRELAWLQRGAKARTTKQKARIDRVHDLKDQEFKQETREFDFAIGSKRLGNDVIELKGVSHSFSGKELFYPFDYLLVKGERLGIIGPNGSGKSSLLNIMAGRIQPVKGEVHVGETVEFGYYTQEDHEIDGDLKVIEYIKEIAEIVYTKSGDVITAEQMLERFLFPRSMHWTYIRRLSGGEKRRLYLLRVLMAEPNVLFLDEPTNDLDTETLSVLEDYLEQFPGVVVTVSHDRYFLDRVAHHLLVFNGKGAITRFQGSYSDYLEKVNQEKEQEQLYKQEVEKAQSTSSRPQKKKKLSYKEQKDWETIEEKISSLEEKLESIEEEIAAAGSDFTMIEKLLTEQKQLNDELEKAMERWEELSLLVEEFETD